LGSSTSSTTRTLTYTMPADTHYIKFIDEANTLDMGYQLELGSTATPYEPYNSTLEPLTLDDVGIVMGSLPNGVKDTITDTLLLKDWGRLCWNGSWNNWVAQSYSNLYRHHYYAFKQE
jgi:hypothetical protein